eukprot:INCI11002.1.p1 GENE.INCI11002.1~~INCI11002.1.p1  ORF type:complete len:202 (-),score=49.62 INCI11002.1:491-1096(-)
MSVGLRGQVRVDKDDLLSQDALRQRLETLEEFLYGQRRADALEDTSATGSLADRAKALEAKLDTLETHDVKIFQIGLVDIGPRLGSDWAKPVVTASSVPAPVKEKVVLAEAPDVERQCKQLEEVTKLQGYVNPAFLNEIPVYLERVAKLETGYVNIAQKAEAFQQRMRKMLRDYNELVDLLSLKAAEWDAALAKLEDKVDV